MPCEPYQNALIEAAASGSEPQGELRAHLVGCVDCRAAFELEQSLFASIDSGLQVVSNSEVPASLLPRVRARLAEAIVAHRRWLIPWPVLSAAVVAVGVLVAVNVFRHTNSGSNAEDPIASASSTLRPTQVPSNGVSTTRSKAADKTSQPQWSGARNVVAQEALVSHSSMPEVLVPDEEHVAFERFLGAQQEPATEFSLAPRPPQETLDVFPLEIAKLNLAPIKKEDAQSSEF